MPTRRPNPAVSVGLVAALGTLTVLDCAGPDHLLEPVLAEGGAFFALIGGRSNANVGARGANDSTTGSAALGGTANSQTSSRTLTDATEFGWGSTSYDPNGGAEVTYQEDHYPGIACFAACHAHTITLGGTTYQSNGTTAAAHVQLGILADGILTTTYSGTAGNFFITLSPADIDWGTAQMAVRTERGTYSMPVNPDADGNCNNCHKNSTNRLVVP